MGAGQRAPDVPEVIRYLEARKRKCQFANPGRKLRRVAHKLYKEPASPSLPRRSNFRRYNALVPLVPLSFPFTRGRATSKGDGDGDGDALRNTRRRSGREIVEIPRTSSRDVRKGILRDLRSTNFNIYCNHDSSLFLIYYYFKSHYKGVNPRHPSSTSRAIEISQLMLFNFMRFQPLYFSQTLHSRKLRKKRGENTVTQRE